jgi:hypothetical protein
MQSSFANAKLSADVPQSTTYLQSLIDGRVLGMGTDSTQPSHLSRNNTAMSRKNSCATHWTHDTRGPGTQGAGPIRPVTLRATRTECRFDWLCLEISHYVTHLSRN